MRAPGNSPPVVKYSLRRGTNTTSPYSVISSLRNGTGSFAAYQRNSNNLGSACIGACHRIELFDIDERVVSRRVVADHPEFAFRVCARQAACRRQSVQHVVLINWQVDDLGPSHDESL